MCVEPFIANVTIIHKSIADELNLLDLAAKVELEHNKLHIIYVVYVHIPNDINEFYKVIFQCT